jgi:hypothetical protein
LPTVAAAALCCQTAIAGFPAPSLCRNVTQAQFFEIAA